MSFILGEDEAITEQKYQQLMNEYNAIKEQNKEMPSIEALDAQLDLIEQQGQQQSGDTAEIVEQLKARIQEQEQSLHERKAKNNDKVADLSAKVKAKENELNQLRVKQKNDQMQLEKLQESISRAREVLQQESRQLELLADQQPGFLLGENGGSSIQDSKKKVNSLSQKLLELQRQATQIEDSRANHENSRQGETLEDIQEKIQGENEQIGRLQEQLKRAKEEVEGIVNGSAAASETEQKRKAKLQDLKQQEKAIKTNIEQMKAEIQKMHQQKKKKQSRPVFNPKIEILKLEKENEILAKEKDRQIKKLKEYANISKTYVKYDELVKLNEELDHYRILNKPLVASIATYEKLQENNKHLRKSIISLKEAEDMIIAEKEASVAKAQEKVKEITENKAFYTKSITYCSSKLAEYMKEFPNHEKQKQEKKQKQKELKAEEKRKRNEQIKNLEKKHKKKIQNSKTDEQQDILNLNLLNSEADPNKQSSAINSSQVAIGTVLLLLLVTFVWYNL